ncbi:MAG: RnfABCDGE type electron transport complex subunit G [Candidatus Eisenbacteria bacterium]|uniref:Ion-translocating oxidoreductase complex subunit G n=1 Tax=Eiseniibacteriota bacterium TaxID=2212470 RepID=A0A938BRE2_UNCEI|nr:RnfABCDGE type electron transport complex subunit G [Candidatus Eisenbacteria bacterium]
MRDILRMVLVLTAICLLSAFSLTALNEGLAGQIAKQQRDNVQVPRAREVLGETPADFAERYFEIEVDGVSWAVFPRVEGGRCSAIALESTGRGGYAGDVKVIAGVDLESGAILGVRVTQSSETPGIGSRVAEPSYLRVYRGRPLKGTAFSLRAEGGDIEAVSGATRTSAAVVDGVRRAAEFVLAHRDEIVRRALGGQAGS